jgi:tetratricopeptide (TPR) repeat protein
MATVWRAEDELLGRHVALKVLSESHVTSARTRKRFLQEARLAGALEHPGIATVFDAGESEGRIYIAFALVDGQTVSERIAEGPLDIAECVRIGIAASEALGHAHTRGAIHRDVSGRNIMVARDGRVYVLDFGLARIRGATRITDSEEVLGTLPYMAPEVARSRRATAAADVYGLGVVLFEALTGSLPFGMSQPAALLYAILNTAPPSPRSFRPEIPPALEDLVLRALAKSPRNRPRHGVAMAEALRSLDLTPARLSDPAPAPIRLDPEEVWNPPQRSLQVLLFEDVGTDLDERGSAAALARGLAASLSARLASLPGLQVIASPAPGEVRSHPLGPAQLELRGAVSRAGAHLRVAFSLIDSRSGVQLSGDALDGSIATLFDLEDRLAASVVQALGYDEAETRPVRGARDPAAHEHYLKALGYLQRYDHEPSVDGAIRLLESLIASEGESASVRAALGRAYLYKYRLTFEPRWEAQAASACDQALTLDPRAVDVLVTLGQLRHAVGHHSDAIAVFRQALELHPEHAEAWLGLSVALEACGRIEEAESAARRAIAARPHAWSGYNRLGLLCFRAGRFEEALAAWKETVRVSPDNARGHYNMGAAYFHLDRLEEAVDALRRSIGIEPTASAYASLGAALFASERWEDAVQAFESATALRPADAGTWGNLGSAGRWIPGQEARAREALEHAVALMKERLDRNPVDAEGWVVLAGWLESLGRRAEAGDALARWEAIEPHDVRSMALAGVTCMGMGRREEGLRWLREALSRGYSVSALRREPELQKLREDPVVRELLGLDPQARRSGASPSP